jgi:lipopolysaccharide transport system permease protein
VPAAGVDQISEVATKAHTVAAQRDPATTSLESRVGRRIVPAKRRLRLRDLPRDLLVVRVLAARDFKVKYKQSVLGPLWLVFQPLALLAAFLVAFKGLAGVETLGGVPYAVFALVGLSVWAFFQAAMTIGAASLITNYTYVRFTPCPRFAFPLAGIIASLPSFAVTAAAAIVAAAATGSLSARVVLIPLGLAWLLLLTAGIVLIAASLAVRYRDVISALPFLLQVGVFLAPVGYPLAELSDPVRAIVDLNPVTGVIEGMRWMMLSGYYPSFEPIGISLAATAVLVCSGWLVFSRLETTMADEI